MLHKDKMNIRDLLDKSRIVADITSIDKESILGELAAPLATDNSSIDLGLLTEKLLERENLSSTGIGDGIAIPHCKYKKINGIIMSFGRSVKGVDFDSIDNKDTNLFFLLVAPDTPKAAGEHLRTLAKITRILKNNDFRNKLMSAETSEEIYRLIAEEDEKY